MGDLVVLIEDNMPTFKWLLGRVTKIYSGNDTLIRVVKVKTQNAKSSQMRLGLPSTPVVGDRCGVSDGAVAAIASSVLHDVGLITSNNSDLVVDENKLRREKAKVRKDLKFQALSEAQALTL
ncbi:hypothetical protein AVEN_14028-1 [Araneus ventricosus]|uniref:DUF5641 domain-containing protein n=1 Tax=Araneus ventricosus TaxID=182803 RepID=A0A4Y2N4W3_ARAVE|nr:hypothetical protein AVEN_14028-1 [Araneus ventricosus]